MTVHTSAEIALALQRNESGGRVAVEGDGGRALGNLQFHPAAFWDWCEKPSQSMTWAAWFLQAAENFVTAWVRAYPDGTEEECAIVFHQHCYLRHASADDYRADDYGQRFLASLAALEKGKGP